MLCLIVLGIHMHANLIILFVVRKINNNSVFYLNFNLAPKLKKLTIISLVFYINFNLASNLKKNSIFLFLQAFIIHNIRHNNNLRIYIYFSALF